MLNDTGAESYNAESYFDLAMRRARVGDVDTAAHLFRQASDRGHALAAYALASLLKDHGQLAEAEIHYRRALASGLPSEEPQLVAECELSLGYLRAQAGDDDEAERFYRAADARGNAEATFNFGNLLSRTGRIRQAEDAWRRAAAAGQPDAAYNLAELVGERGDLEEAERLLRQALAAGITDALNNLAGVRLRRGDPAEAETLLRQAVAAGDHNAVFNLGIVLDVRGKREEAEAMLRRAAAAGHAEAPAHLQRLVVARQAQAPSRPEVAVRPQPVPERSDLDKGWLGGLRVLFAEESSNADRMRAAREFVANALARLQSATNVAGRSRDMLAERSAQLVSELATRLPIRDLEALRRQAGDDPEAQSQHVVNEAGRLAGLLWAVAAVVPGPPPVVRAVKVVVHSAIEIRMIGELYVIHSGTGRGEAGRDAAWLGTVLLAWASGQPVVVGHSVAANTSMLVGKIRSCVAELTSSESRLATLASRGRVGTNMVVRNGTRIHRRMRLHPTSWARPDGQSIGRLVGETFGRATGRVAADRLARRIPQAQALVSAAQDRLASAAPPAAADEISGSSPRDALAHAWELHMQAATAGVAMSTSDPVAARLSRALAAQQRHLLMLSRQLGQGTSPVPAQRDGRGAADAGRLVWQAEDAIDAVEELGAQPRRLASWSTRGRAALAYLVTALAVSVLPAVMLLNSSGLGTLGLLLGQCLVLPWVSLATGATAIGPLFRPWLGGPVPRHPVVGTWIVVGVHLGMGTCAAVLGALL